MKTIGILGGLGPESTIAYYAHITRRYYELRSDYAYPEILIHSFNFKEFIEAAYELPDRVRTAIENLHRAGADFVIAACNSVHVVYEEVSRDIPIPWISIMAAAGEEIRKSGLKRVGLLGTVFTMDNTFYQRGLRDYGIEAIIPEPDERKIVNRIIYDELVKAEVNDRSRRAVLEVVEELIRRGAEGIVLGCTELPFLIGQDDAAVPVFDATAIHAEKALELALA